MSKKFIVSVVRIAYAVREIEVEAENEEQAQENALEIAGNEEFSTHSSVHEVEAVYQS